MWHSFSSSPYIYIKKFILIYSKWQRICKASSSLHPYSFHGSLWSALGTVGTAKTWTQRQDRTVASRSMKGLDHCQEKKLHLRKSLPLPSPPPQLNPGNWKPLPASGQCWGHAGGNCGGGCSLCCPGVILSALCSNLLFLGTAEPRHSVTRTCQSW